MSPNNDLFAKTLINILEKTAFIFIDDLPTNNTFEYECDCIGIEISYTGDSDGSCSLWIAKDLATEIAANMLGCDENEIENKQVDACKEILNMTVGNYLTEKFGEEPVFNVGIPNQIPENNPNDTDHYNKINWIISNDLPIAFILSE